MIDEVIQKQVEEFRKKFTYMGRNQADQLDCMFNPYTDPHEVEAHIRSSMKKVAERIANKIYDAVPSGEATAFDLIKIMKKLYEEVSLTDKGE